MPIQMKGTKINTDLKLDGNFVCCGLFELCGISWSCPIESVARYWKHYVGYYGYSPDDAAPFVVYTGKKNQGDRLTKYIKKHKLGQVLKCPPRNNSTGSHNLCAWVWLPVSNVGKHHAKQFEAHYKKLFGNDWKTEIGWPT